MWTLVIVIACQVTFCSTPVEIRFATYSSEDACKTAGEGLKLYRGANVERFQCQRAR